MKKVIVSAIMIAVILLGGCDSMKIGRRMNINDEAIAYMEQKYGEKFEYSAPFGNSMSGTHQLLVKCASFPNQNIVVSIENYRTKDRVFLDNYLAVKFHTEYTELFQSYASEVFGEAGEATVFCRINTMTLSPELLANATIYEYLADTSAPLVLTVKVKESDFISEEQAKRFAELIAANGSYFSISFIVVDDSEYETFDIEALYELVGLKKYIRYAIITRLDSNGIRTEWS